MLTDLRRMRLRVRGNGQAASIYHYLFRRPSGAASRGVRPIFQIPAILVVTNLDAFATLLGIQAKVDSGSGATWQTINGTSGVFLKQGLSSDYSLSNFNDSTPPIGRGETIYVMLTMAAEIAETSDTVVTDIRLQITTNSRPYPLEGVLVDIFGGDLQDVEQSDTEPDYRS